MEELRFSIDEEKYDDRHGQVLSLGGWYAGSDRQEMSFCLVGDGNQELVLADPERYERPDVAQALAGAALDGEGLMSRLTPREFDVLRLAVSGESTGSIASTMHLSQKTIHNHMTAIRQKLDADNDFKLLQLAARYGLIDWSAGVS